MSSQRPEEISTAIQAQTEGSTPHQAPSYTGAAGSVDLQKTTSGGGWGERNAGERVDVANALNLARSSSNRNDQENTNKHGGTSSPVQEESSNDLERQETHFNLEDFLTNRLDKADQQGVTNKKALGMAWRDLEVKLPGGRGGYTFVKTLPVAIFNTAYKDPWSILTTLIPPLGKLGNKSKGASKNLLHPRECLIWKWGSEISFGLMWWLRDSLSGSEVQNIPGLASWG